MIRRRVTLGNRLGLHARAASRLVQTASRFDAGIQLVRDGQRVNAKSIMGVLMLAAPCGTELVIEADGDNAEAAADAVAELVANRFGEGT